MQTIQIGLTIENCKFFFLENVDSLIKLLFTLAKQIKSLNSLPQRLSTFLRLKPNQVKRFLTLRFINRFRCCNKVICKFIRQAQHFMFQLRIVWEFLLPAIKIFRAHQVSLSKRILKNQRNRPEHSLCNLTRNCTLQPMCINNRRSQD